MEQLTIGLRIENVKNIKKFEHEFSFTKGIYALVGENAVGKSTVMSAIASTVYPQTVLRLGNTEVNKNSLIELTCKGYKDIWTYSDIHSSMKSFGHSKVVFNGIYEGSVFLGTRFDDMRKVDKLIQEEPGFTSEFVNASEDLKHALSTILHDEEGYYSELYKLKNMNVAKKYYLNNMPYFLKLEDGQYISKFKMSSGECMMISLLNFINSYALQPEKLRDRFRKQVVDKRLFVFIDEVELALHPSCIMRLVDYLENMIKSKDLTVLFSSHSGELIKKIKPDNIFYLENDKGNLKLITPCYPNYAIRSLYDHDGYDSTILVEDKLTEIIVRRLVEDFRINNNLLINVLPIGAWNNTLAFQARAIKQNAFGRDKFLFSVIDGDVKEEVKKCDKYQYLKKLFLPIKSVEKYLYQKLIIEKDREFIKKIGNRYFVLQPLEAIIREFNTVTGLSDNTGKKLFDFLLIYLSNVGLNEESFVKSLCDDLFEYENFDKLKDDIEKFIQENFYISSIYKHV
ncbi:MAG: AAA family ATPase [Clostridiales bacterium]|jgi:energy-coupling factor transporter ATP-binding protein EcfA2|nr:AAA family ATPase [Clostridiales bacterium]